ncbi:MAG: M20 family metallopeptidase [Oscillospiraceae bacterium]|nr:M20 family metallopeptidase [Oscillospiraceae bacterium]
MKERILKLIDERREELFSLLSELLKINSENFAYYGNEEECARYIKSYCEDIGIAADMFAPTELEGFEKHPDYWPGRALENRFSVVATLAGKENKNGLMLMAHTDTVEIGDISNWTVPPLSGLIKDEKIYGRGASDDKYGVAAALFVMKLLKEIGFVPKENLLFSAYSDEEAGGSHGALSSVLKYPCEHILNLDGEHDQIWHCATGGQEAKYLYRTRDTVDSAELSARAIPVIMDVLKEFKQNRYTELSENKYYNGTVFPESSMTYQGIRAGCNGTDLNRGEIHFMYYTDKTEKEIYDELALLEKKFASVLEPMGIIGEGFVPYTRFFHYVFCEPDAPDIKKMLDAAREVSGCEPVVCGSCLSDLSVISKYGSRNAFTFGAARTFREEGGAHQPDEFIECDKLLEFAKIIAVYILNMLG